MQIDHVAIPVADLDTARAFYEQALAPFGVHALAERPSAVLFEGDQGDGMFSLRQGTEYRTPMHVAFSTDRTGVDAFYEAALAAGGTDNGAPRDPRGNVQPDLLRRLRPRSGRE